MVQKTATRRAGIVRGVGGTTIRLLMSPVAVEGAENFPIKPAEKHQAGQQDKNQSTTGAAWREAGPVLVHGD